MTEQNQIMNNQGKLTRRLTTLAKVALAVILVIILARKTDLDQFFSVREQMEWAWLPVCVVVFFSSTLLKALQYQRLLGDESSFLGTLQVVIWQNLISNFVHTSAGVASYALMLKAEHGVKLTRSGFAFILTKFGNLLIVFIYLVISSTMLWDDIVPLRPITILLAAVILSCLTGFLLTVMWRERFVSSVIGLLKLLRLDHLPLMDKGLDTLRALAREERGRILSALRTAVFLSAVYMTVTMFLAYATMRVFGVRIGILPIVYVASLIQLVSFVPIQAFGGLGVTELTSVYLYSVFSLSESRMTAVMFGARALTYLLNAATLLYFPIVKLLQLRQKKTDP